MGPLTFASPTQTWSRTLPAPPGDALDVTATNVPTASIDLSRAFVDCNAMLNITTNGRITISLTGCNRSVQAGLL